MKKLTALILLLASAGLAHELEDNRATLVLRDGTHLSLTIYLAYPEALHQALRPSQPFAAFLLACSAMSEEELSKDLERAQARFEAATHLLLPEREAAWSRWSWPNAATVRAMLQRRVMQSVVDPAAHVHEAPVEIHAELVAPAGIEAARVQFPKEWRKLLVVWFRPAQQWVDGGSLSDAMRFDGGAGSKE